MDKTSIEHIKERSLTGPIGTKTGKKEKVRRIRYDRLLGSAAILFATGFGLNEAIEQIKEFNKNNELIEQAREIIKQEIIEPNSFTVNPNPIIPETSYNYKEIANNVSELGKDEIIGVYILRDVLGPEFSNYAIRQMGYNDYDEYLEKHDFKNEKEMKKHVIEQLKAKELNEELYSSGETYSVQTNETFTQTESGIFESNNNDHSRGGL